MCIYCTYLFYLYCILIQMPICKGTLHSDFLNGFYWLTSKFEICCDYVILMEICLLATGKHGAVFVLPLWMPLRWGGRNGCVWVYGSRAWRPGQTTSTWDLCHFSWLGPPAVHCRTGETWQKYALCEFLCSLPSEVFTVNKWGLYTFHITIRIVCIPTIKQNMLNAFPTSVNICKAFY